MKNKGHIHFIAIGGAVMHNLALALNKMGYTVTGSDDEIFDPALSNLRNAAILPEAIGWFPEKISNALESVVVGMHARSDNPELIRARELNLPVFSFPEFIFEKSRNKTRIVIGGSHGKTSITSMIMHALRKAGKDFDYLVGARIDGFELTVHLSNAPVILIEGDEYPDSAWNRTPKFHIYKPDIAFISGISWDHINIFPTFENYMEQFEKFLSLVPADGKIIFNSEDKEVVNLISDHKTGAEKISYKTPAYTMKNGKPVVRIMDNQIPLSVSGKHNVQNLAGAAAVCQLLGVSENDFWNSVQDFKGAARRLEVIAEGNNSVVIRDFAHAPSKLMATVSAVRETYPDKKVIAIFELHTFSSLSKKFLPHYHDCLAQADVSAVFYSVQAIHHKKLEPISDIDVQKGFNDQHLPVFSDRNLLEQFIRNQISENSVLLLMSSGNFDSLDLIALSTFATQKI